MGGLTSSEGAQQAAQPSLNDGRPSAACPVITGGRSTKCPVATVGSSAKCAIIIGGHTAKCAVTTAVPTTVTPEATAYHSAADRYIYSGPPRRAASPLFFSSFFFSFPPSYTLRRWVRGPGGGGGSAAYFYFPRNYFVWEILKIDSRPPNAPVRAHGWSDIQRGCPASCASLPERRAAQCCMPCNYRGSQH